MRFAAPHAAAASEQGEALREAPQAHKREGRSLVWKVRPLTPTLTRTLTLTLTLTPTLTPTL